MRDGHVVRQAKPSSALPEKSVEAVAREGPAIRLARRLATLAAVFAIASWLTLLWLPGRSLTATDPTSTPCGSQVSCAEAGAPGPSAATLERWSGASDRSAGPDQEPEAHFPTALARLASRQAAAHRALQRAPRFSDVASPNIRGPPA
jgi:hypothetical protein